MTQPAKHTPGPIHNGKPSLGQPCTCCILLRTGKPLESIHGKQPCANISHIELCPKHAAAPAMYEAIRKVIEHRVEEYLDNTIEPYCSLVAALAQAEARL